MTTVRLTSNAVTPKGQCPLPAREQRAFNGSSVQRDAGEPFTMLLATAGVSTGSVLQQSRTQAVSVREAGPPV